MNIRRLSASALLAFAAFAMAGHAEAALAPQWQRLREFQAVIDAAARTLDAPIDTVRRVNADHYEVRAGACSLAVRIAFQQSEIPGPVPFSVHPGRPKCD